jgi:hypothetical protein
MMKPTIIAAVAVTFGVGVLVAPSPEALARTSWNDHPPPFEFLFGNHIDTHQQTKLTGEGELSGHLYIRFVDEDGDGVIDETDDGLPIAKHCTKAEHYEDGACIAGWKIRAKPCVESFNGCRAMFLYHHDDHPVWLLGAHLDGDGELRGSRNAIPQPGAYVAHYHWLTAGSEFSGADGETRRFPSSLKDLEAVLGVGIEVPEGCNVAMAKELSTGAVCPGYFFKLRAVREFAFVHGGETMPVRPGLDMSTHINVVTSYRSVDWTPTEEQPPTDGGGHGDGSH